MKNLLELNGPITKLKESATYQLMTNELLISRDFYCASIAIITTANKRL